MTVEEKKKRSDMPQIQIYGVDGNEKAQVTFSSKFSPIFKKP